MIWDILTKNTPTPRGVDAGSVGVPVMCKGGVGDYAAAAVGTLEVPDGAHTLELVVAASESISIQLDGGTTVVFAVPATYPTQQYEIPVNGQTVKITANTNGHYRWL